MAGIGNSMIDELYLKLAEDKERKNHVDHGPKKYGGSVNESKSKGRQCQRTGSLEPQQSYQEGREHYPTSNYNTNFASSQNRVLRGRPQVKNIGLNSGQSNENKVDSSEEGRVVLHSKKFATKKKTFMENDPDSSQRNEQRIPHGREWGNHNRNLKGNMQTRNQSLNRKMPWNMGLEIDNAMGHTTKRSLSSQSLNRKTSCSLHSEKIDRNINQHAKVLGFKRLQGLCEETPTEIVTTLMKSNSGFKELLHSDLRPDFVVLVVTLLAKSCACEFKFNKAALISFACQTPLFEHIKNHMFHMPTDETTERKNTMGLFFSNLLTFYEAVMIILPNTASEKFRNLFISTDMSMKGVEKYQSIVLSEQREQFCKLEKQLLNIIEERETKKIKMRSKDELFKYMVPPDDFREKSVYPSLEDLFGDETPFIRPNIVVGSYIDTEQYLDIQFRLLREDFISPLRDGLIKLRVESQDSKKRPRIDNVRVYRKVVFGNPKVINDLIGIVVQFDPEKRLNIKWEYSKRFMFGSLLLFTNDNFKHVIFGTVLARDLKDLKNGEVIVSLHQDSHRSNVFGSSFLMVESEVYFEPYKHVLRALQGFDESSFPMKEYIVQVQKESYPPKYLLLAPEFRYDLKDCVIQVLNETSWPQESTLGLDRSQLIAFRAALTEEFVIIQGPPGTGKTYLGLKIARVLLRNVNLWNSNKTPILVVCYTNHALDQFLEGLVSETDQIVRVGGQSKSSILARYNLREKRRALSFKNSNTYLKREYHAQMSELMRSIKTMQANLEELEKPKGIVSVQTLKERKIISLEHKQFFETQGLSEDAVIQEWLFQANDDFSFGSVTEGRPDEFGASVSNEKENEDDEEKIEGTWLTADIDHMDFDLGDIKHNIRYAIHLQFFEERQRELMVLSNTLARQHSNPETEYRLEEIQQEYISLQHYCQYWKSCLAKNHQSNADSVQRLLCVRNLWQLSGEDRWLLYKFWINMWKKNICTVINKFEKQYRDLAKKHEEMKQICDYDIMQNSLVVGMTTTNAARLQNLLQALKPKIVIVEEAAEVLESHIVVSLTNKCEHVILIGDHQQLRPAPAVYKLARDYNFDISLFERMVKNGMRCYCLEKQHRMRPEVAKLIVPTIYPELKNDISVYNYPAVRGITKSLFFITHNVPEEEVTDIMSHKNSHEADFVLALCRHLIWQGYQPAEITILVTYKGQMFYMRNKQKNMSSIKEVNVTVVDNYQGEENKIILLSLVRSNEEGKIGFLKIENRVCVALSRAQEGLYIIGNMDNLVGSSKVWPCIKDSLVQQNSFGTHLTLQCQIHSDQLNLVNCAGDFKKVPEGGCSQLCNTQLQCGHQCESICHVNNREHKEYRCQKKCRRIPEECSFDHLCSKLCYETCGQCETSVLRVLPCGHVKDLPCYIDCEKYSCIEKVTVKLPNCEHTVSKPCHNNISTYPCPVLCNNRLPCGHSCISKCHVTMDPDHLEYKCTKPCAKTNSGCTMDHQCTKLCHEECGLCGFEIPKKLPRCNHVHSVKCSQDPATVECKKSCTRIMICGHKCPRKCYETCGGCQVKVKKAIPSCGHEVKIKCCEIPYPSLCKRPCQRLLPCGHGCVRQCGQECAVECTELVRCPVTPLCGHTIQIPCHMQNNADPKSSMLMRFCQAPCGTMLHCGHRCQGTCGECMQGRIHVACAEKCERNFICGHKCKAPCSAFCPPCSSKCQYKCKHSKCNKTCGFPCVSCKEKCNWKCEHLHCTKLCSQPCNRKPCYEPCKKKLKCGHNCIGFCGDPCPPLCRICDEDQVKEVFFGNEDEEDARFVYLVDCHHTLESVGLEQFFAIHDNEIKLKTCPRCKTPIMRTERFTNYVKQTFKDVINVKRKYFGEMKQLDLDRKELLKKLAKRQYHMYMISKSKMYAEMLKMCETQLQLVRNNRIQHLSQRDLISMKSQIDIFDDLLSSVYTYVTKHKVQLKEEVCRRLFNHFDLILGKVKEHHGKLNVQSTTDFNRECKRFMLATQLAVLENSPNFTYSLNQEKVKVLYERACSIIQAVDSFTDSKHAELRQTIENLKKSMGVLSISERERKEIVQAIGLAQGHWYKCPNGHVYCIGECGGAMETSQCPDCKATIGGHDHHLLHTNSLASEMDGARRHAYQGGLY